jgi:Tfp pilus assembly protein PilF
MPERSRRERNRFSSMTTFQVHSRLSVTRAFLAAAAVVLLQAGCNRGSESGTNQSPADIAAQAAVMQRGLDLLYKTNDPASAADTFRAVLKMNPTHYGARFQLAKALDLSGKPAEARPLWSEILKAAESINDTSTAATAKARLAQPDTVGQAAMMSIGLNLLYNKNDPAGAAEQFKKVLAKNPNHYGGNFQLAKALDQAGKPDEARRYWQKSLTMAESIKDQPTIDAVRARLDSSQVFMHLDSPSRK